MRQGLNIIAALSLCTSPLSLLDTKEKRLLLSLFVLFGRFKCPKCLNYHYFEAWGNLSQPTSDKTIGYGPAELVGRLNWDAARHNTEKTAASVPGEGTSIKWGTNTPPATKVDEKQVKKRGHSNDWTHGGLEPSPRGEYEVWNACLFMVPEITVFENDCACLWEMEMRQRLCICCIKGTPELALRFL